MEAAITKDIQILLGSFLDALSHPVALLDLRFNLVHCNAALRKITDSILLEDNFREGLKKFYESGDVREISVGSYPNPLEVITAEGNLSFSISSWSPMGDASFYVAELQTTKRSEDGLTELKEKVHFYESVLDSLPADIAVFDVNQRYLYLNQHAVKDEDIRKWMIGKDDFDYVKYRNLPISIAESRRARFNHLISEELQQYSFEETIVRNNIRTTNLRMMKSIHDHYGRFIMAVGYGLNIDQLKNYETQIKNQEIAIEISPDGIALLDEAGQYTYMNDAHVKMYGFENQEDLIGKSWKELYSHEEIERIEHHVFPILMKEGTWSGETCGYNKFTGKQIDTEISLTLLPDQGLVCICRDITERKFRDRNFKQLAVVASQTASMVLITDALARIEWVNEAFLNRTGYTLEELLGKYPGELLDGPDTDPEVILQLREATQQKIPFSGEKLAYMKDGSKVWFFLNATPIFNESGDLVNWVSVETDITLLKDAEERIRTALNKERHLSELKSRFVSMASHEFRTPLAGIMTSIELIRILLERSGVNYDDRIGFHMDRAMDEIERMTTIMDNILLFGKLESGQVRFQPEQGDFCEFIRLQAAEFRLRFPDRKIVLKTSCSSIDASFDQKLMGHVISNLLSNAVKYSPAHEVIELAVSCSDQQYEVTITDNGIGIPESEQHLLFSSFFRASNTESVSGTGMGLVIVKQFLEIHKGEIKLTSKESEGCVVQISLPLNLSNE
jgi:PAS domain S-box-containing protein